jgi:hypothetical protein
MEIWKLLLLLVLILALGTFSNFMRLTNRRIAGPFTLHKNHLHEGFGGGFGVGFNGGFGIGGAGSEIDRKNRDEPFYDGGHGGHGGGHGGHHGGYVGPAGYGGPNQGTWRGSNRGGGGDDWGWYGWSYPWAAYGPIEEAVTCNSNADCGMNGVCADNKYCMY